MMHLMGSNFFFDCYEDFHSHDIDFIELTDDPSVKTLRIVRGQGEDYFFFKRKPKEQLIKDALISLPMCAGKFLIPAFDQEIGFTVEDLVKIKPLIDKLDEKHTYEKIIYDAYIKNNSFTLTPAQRLKAYNCYKRSRGIPTLGRK